MDSRSKINRKRKCCFRKLYVMARCHAPPFIPLWKGHLNLTM
uniref:Uncharacterized protein n=1 Tax=Anopheles funestus TaxID=62324 RepID=A0A182S1N8_ANOFN